MVSQGVVALLIGSVGISNFASKAQFDLSMDAVMLIPSHLPRRGVDVRPGAFE